jgi:hypothetical protein
MVLSEARSLLHTYVGPEGPTSLLVPARINELCERFFVSGRWKGMLSEVELETFQGSITLPRRYEAILGVTVKGAPKTPFSRWHHFAPGGPGHQSDGAYRGPSNVVDAGDHHPVTQNPSFSQFRLRVKVPSTSDRDTANYLLLRGRAVDGTPVYSEDGTEGVALTMAGEVATTDAVFSKLESVVKPLTNGFVTLYAVALDGAEEELANYEPGETQPRYRRYQLTGEDEPTAVRALCKRRFVPVLAESDEIVPSNFGALKLGLMSLKYEDTNDMERANEYFMKALMLLNSELKEARGSQLNTLRVSPHGFGLGRVAQHY